MQSTSSLPLLSGLLLSGVVAPGRVLAISKIELWIECYNNYVDAYFQSS